MDGGDVPRRRRLGPSIRASRVAYRASVDRSVLKRSLRCDALIEEKGSDAR